MLKLEGRCGGGIAYQDTARVHPCSLFLDIPVSQGPGKQYPHPSFTLNVVHPSETIGLCYSDGAPDGYQSLESHNASISANSGLTR